MPSPLSIGTVELERFGGVKGFLCEAAGLTGAADITDLGGWQACAREGQAGDGGCGMSAIPIIDVSAPAATMRRYAGWRAGSVRLREVGFFYVIGHSVGTARMAEAFAASGGFSPRTKR